MFTKKKLAAISSGIVLMGAASFANAVQDLDATPTAVTYAGETSITSTNKTIGDGGSVLDLTLLLNPNATPANTDMRVKIELSGGATFGIAPTMAPIDDLTPVFPAAQPFSILVGGSGQSSVTFDGNSGAGFASSAMVNIDVGTIVVADQSSVTVTATVQAADNFGVTDIKTVSGSYIAFANAISVSSTATTPEKIDVTDDSKSFTTTPLTTNLGTIDITFNATRRSIANSTTITAMSTIIDTATLSATGANGLTAFNQAGGSVTIDGLPTTISGNTATTAGQTTDVEVDAVTGGSTVTVNVPANNAIVIDETTTTGAVTTIAKAGYSATSSTATGLALGELERNGSSARLTFALTPNGAFSSYVRISNPAAISGDVTFVLTNDAGTSSPAIGLGSVANVQNVIGDALGAGASTNLMNINDIFAAAEAQGFALAATSNKLRMDITAEFGTNQSDSAVVVNSFSIGKLGNVFSMQTDAAVSF